LAYLDASAYVKLPLRETEEEALRGALAEWDGYVSSALLGVEAVRACARYGPAYAADARAWLDGVALLPLDDAILDGAASLAPPDLRSLDAIHLATALDVREELGVLVSYDERLAAAARSHGIRVVAPA
jgi:predicted nucleic acid-binding protein